MTGSYEDKVSDLRRRLLELESAVVAFSGGVDSSVLTVVAHEELAGRMIAATGISPSLPSRDGAEAKELCAERAIPHRFVETGEFGDPAFIANPSDRCYHCKGHLYDRLVRLADEVGFKFVVEGTNASDLAGHRPGWRASRENPRVATPFVDATFTKDDVRRLGLDLGLKGALKPASACLSSRVPSGVSLTPELMRRIDAAEEAVRGFGIGQVRVRHHGDIARIEVEAGDAPLCIAHGREISSSLRELGWRFVAMDLAGYRTGGASGN